MTRAEGYAHEILQRYGVTPSDQWREQLRELLNARSSELAERDRVQAELLIAAIDRGRA